MVVSKRVSNAKSEKHYKATGPLAKKKQEKWWQGIKKKVTAHPLLIAFFFFITVFSGIFSFFMQDRRMAFASGIDDE